MCLLQLKLLVFWVEGSLLWNFIERLSFSSLAKTWNYLGLTIPHEATYLLLTYIWDKRFINIRKTEILWKKSILNYFLTHIKTFFSKYWAFLFCYRQTEPFKQTAVLYFPFFGRNISLMCNIWSLKSEHFTHVS